MLFGGVNVDAFFTEYDNDRSGDFAPLRFIRPGHQQVVLGLITTKNGELENPQGVKSASRRGRAVRAARADLPQPAVRFRLH